MIWPGPHMNPCRRTIRSRGGVRQHLTDKLVVVVAAAYVAAALAVVVIAAGADDGTDCAVQYRSPLLVCMVHTVVVCRDIWTSSNMSNNHNDRDSVL